MLSDCGDCDLDVEFVVCVGVCDVLVVCVFVVCKLLWLFVLVMCMFGDWSEVEDVV